MFPISSFLRDQRRKTGGKCRGHLGDWTVTGEGVASDQVSQWLVPTAHAHRPRPPPPESGHAISEPYRRCRFSVFSSRVSRWTLLVAYLSGSLFGPACLDCLPSGIRYLRKLDRNSSTDYFTYHEHRVTPPSRPLLGPRHLAGSWGEPRTAPSSPVPSASGCLAPAPPRRTTQPALARSSPPAPAASGPLLFCRCIPSDCAPGHLAAPSRTAAGPTSTIVTSLGVPRTWLLSFLPSASSPLCPPPSSTLYTLILPSRRHQPAKPPLHRPPNQRATPNPNPNPLLIESRQSESLT